MWAIETGAEVGVAQPAQFVPVRAFLGQGREYHRLLHDPLPV
jgi:hypothetical protein